MDTRDTQITQLQDQTELEAGLRYALDRIAIQEVISLSGIGQDAHQDGDNDILEQWRLVFADDATVDYSASGGPSGDATYRELAEFMRGPGLAGGGAMDFVDNWQHLQGVAVVSIDGDSATATTPHLHTHKGHTDGNAWNLIQSGYFQDRLERRPEGWRIVHRRLEITWMDTFAAAPEQDQEKS
jgi:hypothetical protein